MASLIYEVVNESANKEGFQYKEMIFILCLFGFLWGLKRRKEVEKVENKLFSQLMKTMFACYILSGAFIFIFLVLARLLNLGEVESYISSNFSALAFISALLLSPLIFKSIR
jgi:choline-glycine betaine transporter